MHLTGPVLDKIKISLPLNRGNEYPFHLPLIQELNEIVFPTQVTFLVGENGTGKSTIVEAIAARAGFGLEGGSKNINFKTSEEVTYTGTEKFAECITLSWRKKVFKGYFFRAESFFNVANYLDTLGGAAHEPYGGKSLHEQSHGESFLSFFKHRVNAGGFFIFDEPEAALSPQRQLALLSVMHEICQHPESQFIIATHSPILLAYPGATIYSLDNQTLERVDYKQTKHYEITKSFLDNPELYLKHLFA